jgi:hypothetical protein
MIDSDLRVESYIKDGFSITVAACLALDDLVMDIECADNTELITEFLDKYPKSFITTLGMRHLLYTQNFDLAKYLVENDHVSHTAEDIFLRMLLSVTQKEKIYEENKKTSHIDDVD